MNRFSRIIPHLALVAAVLLGLTAPAGAAEFKGKIKSIDSGKDDIVIVDGSGDERTIHLSQNCKVYLNGNEAALGDLKTDDAIDVTTNKENEAAVVRSTRKVLDAVRNVLKPVTKSLPDPVQARLDTDGGLIAGGVAIVVVLFFLLIVFIAFVQLLTRGKKRKTATPEAVAPRA